MVPLSFGRNHSFPMYSATVSWVEVVDWGRLVYDLLCRLLLLLGSLFSSGDIISGQSCCSSFRKKTFNNVHWVSSSSLLAFRLSMHESFLGCTWTLLVWPIDDVIDWVNVRTSAVFFRPQRVFMNLILLIARAASAAVLTTAVCCCCFICWLLGLALVPLLLFMKAAVAWGVDVERDKMKRCCSHFILVYRVLESKCRLALSVAVVLYMDFDSVLWCY